MLILIYTSPGYLLGGKHINHPITGPTVELYAKYPAAQRPRWQRLVSLTIPQEARQRLAEFFGASLPYPEASKPTGDRFDRPWNVTGRTWIEANIPGPWAVENTPLKSWGIINTETGKSKHIGPVSVPRSRHKNYFDVAMDEANRRNGEMKP